MSIARTKKQIGAQGEKIALSFLKKNKFKVLVHNYTCAFGEIDIIARDKNNILSFIEVKTRTSRQYGTPQESVHIQKQAQICKVALEFIQRYKLENHSARFDVVAVYLLPSGYTIEHIKNAFELNHY